MKTAQLNVIESNRASLLTPGSERPHPNPPWTSPSADMNGEDISTNIETDTT